MKTEPKRIVWRPVSRKWFQKHGRKLPGLLVRHGLHDGIARRGVMILRQHDVEGKSFSRIARIDKRTPARVQQIYHRVRGCLSSPVYKGFVPPSYRVRSLPKPSRRPGNK